MSDTYLVDRMVLAIAKKFVDDDLTISSDDDTYNALAIEIQKTIDDWFDASSR